MHLSICPTLTSVYSFLAFVLLVIIHNISSCRIDNTSGFDTIKSIKWHPCWLTFPLFSLQHPSHACPTLASDHFCGLEVKRPPLENINATNRGHLTIVRALFNKHEVNKMSLKIQLLLSTHIATPNISQHSSTSETA